LRPMPKPPLQSCEPDSKQPSQEQLLSSILEDVELRRQELARRHLLDFITYADSSFAIGPHHLLIANALEQVYDDMQAVRHRRPLDHPPLNRLMIFLPPRHSKSRMCSEEYPAWCLMRDPDIQVIETSYSAELSQDFSRRARNRVAEFGPVLFGAEVLVAKDSAAVGRWGIANHNTGGVVAQGVGGAITGRGGHINIIDDPFKNAEEANSKTIRDKVEEWYKTVLRTRLMPGGAIILIMTRWHEDDLAGRLLKSQKDGGEEWMVINIPALAESDDDPLGRSEGEAIWPDWYGRDYLLSTKEAMGSYLFSALYQQRPRPDEGAIFKRSFISYFDTDEGVYTLHRHDGLVDRYAIEDCWRFQTCDPSASAKASADFFVLSTWAVTPRADLLLLDVLRIRIEGAEQKRLLRDGYTRWSPQLQGIETKAMGLTLFQECRNEGLPVYELKAEVDKTMRSLPAAARYEAGKVFHKRGAGWLGDLEDELLSFPMGMHDDQVDTVSYAAILLADVIQRTQFETIIEYDADVHISPF